MMNKNKTILKEFFKFLKENNALNEYKINTINNALCSCKIETYFQKTESWYENHRCNLINAFMPFKLLETRFCHTAPSIFHYNLINYAFTWANTPQGHSYWSQLNSKWTETIKILYKDK